MKVEPVRYIHKYNGQPFKRDTLKPLPKKIRAKAKVHKKKEALASGMSLKEYRQSLHVKA